MTHDPKKLERMRSRKGQGLTYKEIGDEFGCSGSHAHRLVNKNGEKESERD